MSAKCDKIITMLDAFVDGELTKQDEAVVREHLKTCETCRLQVEELLDLEKQFASLPRMHCPARVEKSIRAATVGQQNGTGKRRSFRAFFESFHGKTVTVGLAAVVTIVFLIVGNLFHNEDPVSKEFTSEEIQKAREEAELGLSYLGTRINRTEKNILEQVLLKDLPETVRKSIRKTVPIFRGGQG